MRMNVIGLFNPTGLYPSFATPILEKDGKYFVAISNLGTSTIQELLQVNISACKITPIRDTIHLKGDKALFCFMHSQRKYIIDEREKVEEELIIQIPKLMSKPFLLAEVGAFIGDKEIIEIAKSLQIEMMTKEGLVPHIENMEREDRRSESYADVAYKTEPSNNIKKSQKSLHDRLKNFRRKHF